MIKDGETPLLYCMLGDATDDPGNYQKAIDLSKGRSARAFRSLGTHHFQRKDYEKATEYLGKSLELNCFQLQTLLRHGYSAMQIKDWAMAAKSYRNYCVYESDVSKIM
jgi:tetratricopeptide (TPR) repeat protein